MSPAASVATLVFYNFVHACRPLVVGVFACRVRYRTERSFVLPHRAHLMNQCASQLLGVGGAEAHHTAL